MNTKNTTKQETGTEDTYWPLNEKIALALTMAMIVYLVIAQ